jgi:hypothetical protein
MMRVRIYLCVRAYDDIFAYMRILIYQYTCARANSDVARIHAYMHSTLHASLLADQSGCAYTRMCMRPHHTCACARICSQCCFVLAYTRVYAANVDCCCHIRVYQHTCGHTYSDVGACRHAHPALQGGGGARVLRLGRGRGGVCACVYVVRVGALGGSSSSRKYTHIYTAHDYFALISSSGPFMQ